ncbi:MAG: SoxR reducing system RseC family protein [Bacteroidales bacterium]|nr:SoxR reducing system RseC family protein [Bacteroidales bacterium]
MSAAESITHPGVIEKVSNDTVFVKVLAMSACSSCHAKSMCNIAEVEEKIVEIKKEPQKEYVPGKTVTVSMKKAQGTYAVLLGYIVPFFLLLGVLLGVLTVSGNEGLAGLLAIIVLIPYYWLLYIYRTRLKSTFSFRIE